MTQATVQLDDQLIRDADVARAYGVDTSTVWRWAKANRIPRPIVQQKRFSRWSAKEVSEHIAKMRRAEREEEAS